MENPKAKPSLFQCRHQGIERDDSRQSSLPARQYFDSAQYFMMLHHEVQKNSKENNDKYIEEMNFHVENFVHQYGENQQTQKIRSILNKKITCKKFDSANHFLEIEKQKKLLESKKQLSEDLEMNDKMQQESIQMEQTYILTKKQNNLVHKKSLPKHFDSADYFMELQKQTLAKRIQEQKENDLLSPEQTEQEQSDLTEKQYVLYKRPLLHQQKQKYAFDSAEFFKELELQKQKQQKEAQENHSQTSIEEHVQTKEEIIETNLHEQSDQMEQEFALNKINEISKFLRRLRTKSVFDSADYYMQKSQNSGSSQEIVSPQQITTNN